MQLRDYQHLALEALRDQIRQGRRRIILVAPTGSGKTVIAAALIRAGKQKGTRVLFLAAARQLIYQASRKLDEFGVDHGVIMAGETPYGGASVQVASRDTLLSRAVKRDKVRLPDAKVVIVDECHASLSKGYREILSRYSDSVVIGLTATPCRGDGQGLGDMYEAIVQAAKPTELVRQGHLVPTRVYAPSEPDLRGVARTGDDYNQAQLHDRMSKCVLVGDVLEHWFKHAGNRQTVVFAPGVAYSVDIVDQFRRRGVTAEHVDGETDQETRDDIFRRFQDGDCQVVSSCGVLREGWDAPWCSAGILLQPTRKLGLYLQMAGRLQRPWEGKRDCILLDHAGAVHRHGFPDEDIDWQLETTRNVPKEREAKREASERQPIVCPKCAYVRAAGPECPGCGYRHEKSGRKITTKDGKLVEVQRKKKPDGPKLDQSTTAKEVFWNQCLAVAANRGQKCTAAAGMYRNAYGVWPRGFKYLPKGKDEWHAKAATLFPGFVKSKEAVRG